MFVANISEKIKKSRRDHLAALGYCFIVTTDWPSIDAGNYIV
jgi:hypothetical protein